MSTILVLDCGSSALKATLFALDGAILGQAESAYRASARAHRQSPDMWWQAAREAVAALSPADLSAISLTGTMENLIPLDAEGRPTADAIMYSDPCGTPWFERFSFPEAATIAGNAPEPLMTAFKLGWFRENEPEAFARTAMVLPGAKDYLVLRLTGTYATDAACAATTGLMDIATRTWSADLMRQHGVDAEMLPPVRPADTIIGVLSAEAAGALGLQAGIPVINGCGDGAATTIGSGADNAEDVGLYLGTSGWVARVAPGTDGAPRPYYRLPHPLIEGLVEIAPILSAGAAAQWARSTLGIADIGHADRLALEADENPGGALFLPYLNGERSPFLDLDLRASFVGVSTHDGQGQLYYAVLEGVAFAIAANLDAMGGMPRKISLVGGGAQSHIWPQILADVLERPISVPANPVAASSLGAFRLGARALGYDQQLASQGRVFTPRAERAVRIARQRERFEAATDFLRGLGRD